MKRHWRSKNKSYEKNDRQKNEFRLVWLRTTQEQQKKRTAAVRYDRFRRISPSQKFRSGIFGSIRMHFKLFAFVVFGMVLPPTSPTTVVTHFHSAHVKILQNYTDLTGTL